MKKTYRYLTGSRKRTTISIGVVIALIATTASFAAWLLFSGVGGSTNGSFGAAQSGGPAFTVTSTIANPVINGPGAGVVLPVTVTNVDTLSGQSLDTLTTTFTSVPAECAAHLSNGSDIVFPSLFTAGQVKTANISINADSTIPLACASGTWTVTFGGTSHPIP